ncbi:MAG: DUF5655 domain-containing protein [Sphingobacteriales bacterium]
MSWICPKCERELKQLNQMHYCIKVSVDDLLKGQSEELVLAFDKLLAEVAEWDGVTVSCSKNCIVFVHKQTFFVIRPMKKWLDLKFYSEKKTEVSFIYKSDLYGKRYQNYIRLTTLDQLTPRVFALVKESYWLL